MKKMKKLMLKLIVLGMLSPFGELKNLENEGYRETKKDFKIGENMNQNIELPKGYLSIEEVRDHISKEYLRMEYISKRSIEKIVKRESNFNIFAVNKRTKAKGLMQILAPTWNEMNPDVPYDEGVFIPEENIKTGIKYLRDLTYIVPKKNPHWDNLSKEEKTAQILACYNWGIGKLEKNFWDLSKSPRETKDYIKYISGYSVN